MFNLKETAMSDIKKQNWLTAAVAVMSDAENKEAIAKDFQELAKCELSAEIMGLEAEVIRKKQVEKRAEEEYKKSAFTLNTAMDISRYIANRDSKYRGLAEAIKNRKDVEETLKLRREQLAALD